MIPTTSVTKLSWHIISTLSWTVPAIQASNFLLPHIVNQLKTKSEIRVNDLEPKRDYIYVKDLVNAIMAALEVNLKFEVFNIGSGESYSVCEIIGILQKISATNFPVNSNNNIRIGEILDTVADISKAKKHLNWSPSWNIYAGLKEVFESVNCKD